MRVLVLGAGALGGYYGGRLLEAGAEVTFLVRPRRRAQLERDGLVVESPFGEIRRRPVATLAPEEAAPGWDIVLLTCKAYDLDDAIAAIRPAVDARSAVLPVLNGLSHMDTLQAAFGRERVLGGLARIAATMTPDGVVRHLNDWRDIVFGEVEGGPPSPRVQALKDAFDRVGKGVKAEASTDILGAMWAKLVNLGTLAAITVMMRASVGEVARAPGGVELMRRMLETNAAIAAAHGHPVSAKALEMMRGVFSDPASSLTASMLRDLESGGRIEADHILGHLLEAGRAKGIDAPLLEAAYVHAKAYENRRDAGQQKA